MSVSAFILSLIPIEAFSLWARRFAVDALEGEFICHARKIQWGTITDSRGHSSPYLRLWTPAVDWMLVTWTRNTWGWHRLYVAYYRGRWERVWTPESDTADTAEWQ